MNKVSALIFWGLSSILIFTQNVNAQVTLPRVFSDHMVLQREVNIPIWGTGKPGVMITAMLGAVQGSSQVDQEGKWMLRLPQLVAGGPFTLSIYEGASTSPVKEFEDVLIGDVWLASGQSNMEWQVQQSNNAKEEIRNANYSNIRLFNVPRALTLTPQDDITSGQWVACDSTTVKTASAVAYFFGRELHTEQGVPIGILQSTWGGTPVEAWTSREMLLSSTLTRDKILGNDTITTKHIIKDSLDNATFWNLVYHPQPNMVKRYAAPGFKDTSWPKVTIPATMKDWGMPRYEGIVWMRKTIEVPKTMIGKDLTLNLGHPEMNYSLYFNGVEICKTVWNAAPSHAYTIPAKLIKSTNIVALRVSFLWGGGGLNPPAENLYLTDGATKVSLAGDWSYQKDLEPKITHISNFHKYPMYLYNAMINPVIPYGLKGFIWYQGEENVSNASDYYELFPMMITDWRVRWQQGYLPFLYVQLTNFTEGKTAQGYGKWPIVRDAQTSTLIQPNTGMACIIDIGEANDIHPRNKQDVGHRLALIAKKQVYGQDIVASGPMYNSHSIKGNEIRIQFDYIGSGLMVRGEKLLGFEVSGADGVYYSATARLEADGVIVSSDKVPNPVAVRYAWADNPTCNLFNSDGLPAVPFKTD